MLEWPMWLCWNGLCGCVGMACHSNYVITALEWPLWLCWNGLCGCVGMASVAVLEWPLWLCWNGLCSCVGTGLCPLFWAIFSHSCLYNPLFWPILWASHAQWDPLANQNIPLFCVIYFWDAVLKNMGVGTRGNLEWPPFPNPWEFGMTPPFQEVYY